MVRFLSTSSACALGLAMSSLGCSAAEDRFGAAEPLESSSEAISMGPVDVIEATYGANCGAPRSNATNSVVDQCDGVTNCPYTVSVGTLQDPAFNCKKDFDVRWACGTMGVLSAHINGEADQHVVTLACQNNMPATAGRISVRSATYGGNCGQPDSNATWDVGQVCNGFGSCRYDVRTGFLGDPAFNCAKEFSVRYTCSNRPTVTRSAFAAKEANGKTVTLLCP
jgi:hypothetical protein